MSIRPAACLPPRQCSANFVPPKRKRVAAEKIEAQIAERRRALPATLRRREHRGIHRPREAYRCRPGRALAFADRIARAPASFDTRYIVTSLTGEARHLYEDVYCARGQAENLIKLHMGQLASDRTSCQSPLANQLRLVLHTGAYWLMLALSDAIPRETPLARAEFATLRLRLLKIGARVVEKAARIRIHFASACPDATLFRLLAGRLAAAGP